MAAEGIDSASGAADIAEQQLQDGGGANDLRAEAVLGPSDGINNGGDFFHVAIFADGSEEVGGLEELILRDAGDTFHHFGCVALILLLQQLIDAARMLQGEIERDFRGKHRRGWRGARRERRSWFVCRRGRDRFAGEVSAFFIIPGLFVVDLFLGIKSGEETVFGQRESVFNNECGVGVIDEIFLRDAVIFDGVLDDAAEEGDVGAGADLQIHVGVRGGAGQTRIYNDGFRVAVDFGFDRPLEAAGVVLGGIPPHDQHHVGVLDVDPTIGHCAASEGGPQTGDRWAVSNAGLVFQVADPQAAHTFDGEIIKFVGVGATASEGHAFATVDGEAGGVLFDESVVARLLYPLRDLGVGLVPGDVFPLSGSGTSDLGLQQTAVVENILRQR